jgi:outer membrane protein TolC
VGQKNKFIKVVGISTAIALSNITASVAQAPGKITEQIAQESEMRDAAQEIQPAQQSIPDVEKLNPSGNPLSFPTTPEEVKVDAQKPITIEQALELSLNNNKEIEEARIQVEQAEAALREQKADLYPTLDLRGGLNYSNDLFIDSIEQGIDQNVEEELEQARAENPNLTEAQLGQIEENAQQSQEDRFTDASSGAFGFQSSLGINYDIYNGGRRGAEIRTAEKQLRSTELDLERVVEEARFETSRDYYELQNRDAQVEIQQAAVQDASQTLKDAQLLQQAGLGTKFEVLQAEVELSRAQQELTTAISRQNIARRQLAETLSVSHSTDLATADTIQEAGVWDLELPETIVQAFKNRAELEQSLLEREISQEQRTRALSQTRPNLSASAEYNLSDSDLENDFSSSDGYQVGLNLQWTLFDGGAARAGAEQAEKDQEIAETRFANLRNQIRFAVEQAFFLLRSNKNNIATTTKGVRLAEESLRLARLRFQSGVGTQTEVIDAQTALTRARGERLSSIIEYNQSYADLTRQVSNTPDNGLQDLP